MNPIFSMKIRADQDIVTVRQQTREIARSLKFAQLDQVKLATAVSEFVRSLLQFAKKGDIAFFLQSDSEPSLIIEITGEADGIQSIKNVIEGRPAFSADPGIGLTGARRLMDQFEIEANPESGGKMILKQPLPRTHPIPNPGFLTRLNTTSSDRPDPFDELLRQNHELLATLEELRQRTRELVQFNDELEDTNRGVVALYAELDEKAESLRRASESQTRFFSNVSHEFRTPLNSIQTLSIMLLDQLNGPLNEEQEKQVSFIQKAAEDLSGLVDDLLDLAKIEAGKAVIQPTCWEIADLFNALRGMLRPLQLNDDAVQLKFTETYGLPTMHTDKMTVSHILRNLISNALKYTLKGVVEVSVHVNLDETVTFSVRDTGIGIEPEEHERIFEEFIQIEGLHQQKVKGTGLGLPLSKRLTEQLGGNLSFESTPGSGSTFHVTIPVFYNKAPSSATKPSIPPSDSPTDSLLIVHEEAALRSHYEDEFGGSGTKPLFATTPEEARTFLDKTRFLAIILHLPPHDRKWLSFFTDRQMQKMIRDIPLFLVTQERDREKFEALAPTEIATEPFRRNCLQERIADFANRKAKDQVLIIDDSEISRYVGKGLLAATRFSTVEAANGIEGLRLARQLKPTAIILDVMMPEMNGFEVIQKLKDDPATHRIPVIMMTSKELTRDEREFLNSRSIAILSKNHFDRETALMNLRAALAKAAHESNESKQ